MLTNMDIVRDHAEIIDTDAILNDGIAYRAAIDRRICPDLNIVANSHAANLRNFHPTIRRHRIAETVGADDNSRMKNAAGTDTDVLTMLTLATNRQSLPINTVRANYGARTDDCVLANSGSIADHDCSGNVRLVRNAR